MRCRVLKDLVDRLRVDYLKQKSKMNYLTSIYSFEAPPKSGDELLSTSALSVIELSHGYFPSRWVQADSRYRCCLEIGDKLESRLTQEKKVLRFVESVAV
jgi:hypothetical protein